MNKSFRYWNNLAGWLVFGIAALTYLLTIEPTASLWDCGEFIAAAYKLEVGHPPGAPFFMLMGRFFSLFAFGDVTKAAMMVNAMSALASAFTILFLFWSISHFARKIIAPNFSVQSLAAMDLSSLVAILGSAAVGSLAYTFSDTFWFSAVEGEVYASSSLFTAAVVWAMLRWENEADEKYANRWLVLIAYLMGVSIGVHLLNLLAIPALVFIYYFKRYEATRKGIIIAFTLSVVILGVILSGIIKGFVSLAGQFELLFVNGFGLPYFSGAIFYGFLVLGLIIFGIYYTHKHQKVILNTVILCFAVILVGYSSYTVTIIRSLADPPMDENDPANFFSLLSYLGREQYGENPLIYGQYYNAPAVEEVPEYTYIQKNGKYQKILGNSHYKYDPKFCTFFPRMYSHQSSHISGYKSWANIQKDENTPPSFADNLSYFFNYQVGFMYVRYFMWNFVGRQNDIQGYGSYTKGNWESGISFIDEIRLGSQSHLPRSLADNKGKNHYYFLPLLLGLFGILFHFNRNLKDSWILILLFFYTGLAIILYTNQPPYQPRERDYAYAGSFYVFAMWIGIGVLSLYEIVKQKLDGKLAAILTSVFCLLAVPTILAKENWDDHGRSNRYTVRDFASNYLNSCEKNAILFTYGDNDTFPLWYAQEVEGIRTDVRVVNLSLLGTDWYINQIKRKAYDSDPVPFSLTYDQYVQGKREMLPVIERMTDTIPLKEIMDFVSSDSPDAKVGEGVNETNYFPTKHFRVSVDKEKVLRSGLVSPELKDSILPYLDFTLPSNYLTKSDLMILDLLATNNWERPVYFATSVGMENYLGLQNYFQLEGFAYKLVPLQHKASNEDDIGRIDSKILYENITKKYKWGRVQYSDVYLDEFQQRVLSIMRIRNVFGRLGQTLVEEGKIDKATEVLDLCLSLLPDSRLMYDYQMFLIIDAYYSAKQNQKADAIVKILLKNTEEELKYYFNLTGNFAAGADYEKRLNMSVLQQLHHLVSFHKQTELAKEIETVFNLYAQSFNLNEE